MRCPQPGCRRRSSATELGYRPALDQRRNSQVVDTVSHADAPEPICRERYYVDSHSAVVITSTARLATLSVPPRLSQLDCPLAKNAPEPTKPDARKSLNARPNVHAETQPPRLRVVQLPAHPSRSTWPTPNGAYELNSYPHLRRKSHRLPSTSHSLDGNRHAPNPPVSRQRRTRQHNSRTRPAGFLRWRLAQIDWSAHPVVIHRQTLFPDDDIAAIGPRRHSAPERRMDPRRSSSERRPRTDGA